MDPEQQRSQGELSSRPGRQVVETELASLRVGGAPGHNMRVASVRECLGGRYELIEVLGRGGMGVVYRARDQVLDRAVAVKVLPGERAQDPVFVARFEREARAVAALNHPNVVSVFDTGSDGDTRFIVMEYVAGRTLAQLLRDGHRPSVARAVQIASQVAGALDAAHRAGLIHRDIKPANVMLDGAGTVRLLDFGIARALEDTSLTQTAVVLGSVSYLAPEVADGERADERSDVYSLGCVLYELLTGRPPFTGEAAAAILHQHGSADPRPPHELNPDVPAALDALVLRMLAKQPDRRPRSAHALATELPRSLQAPLTAAEPRLARSRSSGETPAEPARRLASVRSRRHTRLVAAAALTAIGLLVALLGSSGGHPHRAAARPATTRTGSGGARPVTTSPAPPSSTAPSQGPPATVPAAAGALATLVSADLQSGAIDKHGQNLLKHLQGILAAYEKGHAGDALNKVDDLTSHLADLRDHGDIQPAALAAVTAAIDQLRAAILRTATAPAPGADSPKHGASEGD